jgi:hypothetical protein
LVPLVVAPPAGCRDVLSDVRTLVLPRDQVFCCTPKEPSHRSGNSILSSKALAIGFPHGQTAIETPTILIGQSLS